VFEKVSIQSCHPVRATGADSDTRVAGPATYAFVYPNFMINRYLLSRSVHLYTVAF
jgi:choline monooxygenase